MNDLITVTEHEGKPAINARDLHQRLEVGRDFPTWIKDRIEKYEFVEDEDYWRTKVLSSPNLGSSKSRPQTINLAKSTGGHPPDQSENLIVAKFGDNQVFSHGGKRTGAGRPEIEYLLTIGMAKEIAMVENNP
jgi:phage anti-repressor protein